MRLVEIEMEEGMVIICTVPTLLERGHFTLDREYTVQSKGTIVDDQGNVWGDVGQTQNFWQFKDCYSEIKFYSTKCPDRDFYSYLTF